MGSAMPHDVPIRAQAPLERLVDHPRVTVRRGGPPDLDGSAVVCWLQRAPRAADNPALDVAVAAGNELGKPVVALFVLVPDYPRANLRHYQFLAEGLDELPADLAARRVAFVLRSGSRDEVARFCREARAALVVGDENPVREMEAWRAAVASRVAAPFWTVDADVVVPSRLLLREQYAARTIRPRLMRQLEWFLVAERAPRARVSGTAAGTPRASRPAADLLRTMPVDRGVSPVPGFPGGRAAGRRALARFIRSRLAGYDEGRNHPDLDLTSRLSPYLHFGFLGPREVALAVRDAGAPLAARQAFLEQLIVRRELAVDFVRFNPRYDRLEGAEPWALETLRRHAGDERAPSYTAAQLDAAETHDPLWNACQRQMVESGWMHGYLRMYWAKKILEWSRTPEAAFDAAIEMNDRYELDGRDPNGYAGIAWAIGGKHDRPWGPERPVYGKIRYMSFASTSRKFDSRRYIARWSR
jgi:deoxyribodipyrimidine photo-lyase